MEHVISYSPEFDLKWQDILKLQAARHPLGELNPTRLFYYQFMFTASVVRGGQAAPRLCKSFSGSSLRVRRAERHPETSRCRSCRFRHPYLDAETCLRRG